MDGFLPYKMSLDFQMALAHSPKAMNAFLKLDDKVQDLVIKEANEIKTKREMAIFVENIAK